MESVPDTHLVPMDDLIYIINHLFLPPKLPQKDDSSPANTRALLSLVTNSVVGFLDVLHSQNIDTGVLRRWRTLHKMLGSMEVLHQSEYIPLEGLRDSINNMKIHGAFTSA